MKKQARQKYVDRKEYLLSRIYKELKQIRAIASRGLSLSCFVDSEVQKLRRAQRKAVQQRQFQLELTEEPYRDNRANELDNV